MARSQAQDSVFAAIGNRGGALMLDMLLVTLAASLLSETALAHGGGIGCCGMDALSGRRRLSAAG